MALEMESRGSKVYRIDLTRFAGIAENLHRKDVIDTSEMKSVTADDIVIHAPPHIVHALLNSDIRKLLRQKAIVAYWYWETPVAPAEWKPVALQMDEVWVPTPFVLQALTNMAPDLSDRIKIVPTAINADPMGKTSTEKRLSIRTQLGINPDSFVAGFTFSMESCFERKNPVGAVKAFKLAFPLPQDDVTFILRCHDAAHYGEGHEQLRRAIGNDPRILLLDTPDSYISVSSLYQAIDTFLSLHRSEGFGLTIAEAEQSGAKVVCTGWGLAPELQEKEAIRTVSSKFVPLHDPQRLYRSRPSEYWADPDVEEASKLLRGDYYSTKFTTP